MLHNYLRVALRLLRRNTVYSTINIAGLTIGMTVFWLLSLYISDELSYDRDSGKCRPHLSGRTIRDVDRRKFQTGHHPSIRWRRRSKRTFPKSRPSRGLTPKAAPPWSMAIKG